MSNHLPDSWLRQALGCLVTVQGGNAFKSEDFCEQGIPVIRISNIKSGVIDLTEAVFAKESPSFSKFLALNGDVLVAMSGATTGKIGRYRIDRPAYINQRVGRFVVKDKKSVSIDYIYHLSGAETFQAKLLIDAIGGAQPNISNSSIEALTVDVPPIVEQQKIASILTAVDEVIESTQAQINKLKDLKTGMMQELLTKGIGRDGQPHTEFKDSPVGRIPKEWSVKKLDEVSVNLDSKRVPIKSTDRAEVKGQYPYYGASGIIDYVSDYIFDGEYILLGEDGENVLSRNLPLAFIVKGKSWVNNHAHVLQAKLGINLKFLCEYLESLDYKNIASGSAQPKITKGALSEIHVPVPPIDEQAKIADTLTAIDEKLGQKKSKLDHFKKMKKGLMQDLLSGKVRVNANR